MPSHGDGNNSHSKRETAPLEPVTTLEASCNLVMALPRKFRSSSSTSNINMGSFIYALNIVPVGKF